MAADPRSRTKTASSDGLASPEAALDCDVPTQDFDVAVRCSERRGGAIPAGHERRVVSLSTGPIDYQLRAGMRKSAVTGPWDQPSELWLLVMRHHIFGAPT